MVANETKLCKGIAYITIYAYLCIHKLKTNKDMKKYDWIKIGAYCKWNDVAIDDYDAEEKEIAQNTIYEIFDIRKNVDEEIDDDTIILITSDVSEVEVYAHELIKI